MSDTDTDDTGDDTGDDNGDDTAGDDSALLELIRTDPARAHKTIEALKSEAAAYRQRLRATELERDELKRTGLSEQERAVAEAEARGRASADAEHGRRLLEAEIRAAAAGKLQDPADAVRYLDVPALLELEEADRNLDKAIAKLLEEKAYLAAANGHEPARTRGVPRGSQGARTQPGSAPSSDTDGSEWLRTAAGRSRGRR